MKPYISEILEHNGKTHALPIPAKYRELLDCAHVLGLKDTADEDDMRVVGYRTLYIPQPDLDESRGYVEDVAIELSKLTEAQVSAIGALCHAFSLTFREIMGVIVHIEMHTKGDNDCEDKE